GGRVGIVSKIGRDLDEDSLAIFRELEIQTSIIKTSGLTTNFELLYLREGRQLRLVARCEPILLEDIPKSFLEADSLLVSPIAGEISLDFMKKISRKTDSILAIDTQGFVRKFDEQGNVYFDTWTEGEQILPLVDIVKFSRREALMATDCENIYEAAQKVLNLGPEIVIITLGEEGVLISGKENFSITPKTNQERVVETTGAGDIFFGVFLLEYSLTNDVKNAGKIATIAASKSTERRGMSRFVTRDQIEDDLAKIQIIDNNRPT
ncbi:MAG: PfkB family carbohydrate kinase, partial [Candidatus Jordarchaeaceae archaeon]